GAARRRIRRLAAEVRDRQDSLAATAGARGRARRRTRSEDPMKAVMCNAFGPIADLRLETAPDPAQVVTKVEAASITSPDALIVRGLYQFKPPLPFSPGAEVAGVIEAVG